MVIGPVPIPRRWGRLLLVQAFQQGGVVCSSVPPRAPSGLLRKIQRGVSLVSQIRLAAEQSIRSAAGGESTHEAWRDSSEDIEPESLCFTTKSALFHIAPVGDLLTLSVKMAREF